MKRSYKFRIYPDKEQEIVLKKTIGCCRYIYNWGLETRDAFWRKSGELMSFSQMGVLMTQLRKQPETEWLSEVSYTAMQQSLRNVNSAFMKFFKKKSQFPKFKKRKNGGSARFTRDSFYLADRVFRVNRVKGSIKVVWSRELPSKPSSCVVSKNPSGQWFASFTCEFEPEILSKSKKKIGIDLGIETFATLSDGRKFKQPDSIRKNRRKLARAQRNQDRKRIGSKNREKYCLKVAKIYQKTVNQRNDFLHKLSSQLIHENQVIAIEDLAVSKMVKNRRLARLIGEQGWREFRTMLEYKSNWYGRELIIIDRFSPTSQICNSCGKINKLTLDKRKFKCECGVTYDRDINAAQNILAAGMVVSACGANVRPISNRQSATKQENFGTCFGVNSMLEFEN